MSDAGETRRNTSLPKDQYGPHLSLSPFLKKLWLRCSSLSSPWPLCGGLESRRLLDRQLALYWAFHWRGHPLLLVGPRSILGLGLLDLLSPVSLLLGFLGLLFPCTLGRHGQL